jgi:hypothetical protein
MNQAMVLGLVRHGLTIAAGYLAARGHLDPAAVDTVVAAVLTLLSCGWSIKSKQE